MYERNPKAEVEELVLEEVPDIRYEDIGGLGVQIEMIRDAVELPSCTRTCSPSTGSPRRRGSCCTAARLRQDPHRQGRRQLARRKVAERTGRHEGRSFFLNIKGPELLNKYVGESERQVRESSSGPEDGRRGNPVIVFFDEMDSLFRTRGTGVSSDIETTIVPQFLSEIDGIERLENVIVIGASNRQDLIDPAVLRPAG